MNLKKLEVLPTEAENKALFVSLIDKSQVQFLNLLHNNKLDFVAITYMEDNKHGTSILKLSESGKQEQGKLGEYCPYTMLINFLKNTTNELSNFYLTSNPFTFVNAFDKTNYKNSIDPTSVKISFKDLLK